MKAAKRKAAEEAGLMRVHNYRLWNQGQWDLGNCPSSKTQHELKADILVRCCGLVEILGKAVTRSLRDGIDTRSFIQKVLGDKNVAHLNLLSFLCPDIKEIRFERLPLFQQHFYSHMMFTFARKTFGGLGGAQVYRMTNTFEYGNSTTFDISTYSWCRSLELKEEHVSIAKGQDSSGKLPRGFVVEAADMWRGPDPPSTTWRMRMIFVTSKEKRNIFSCFTSNSAPVFSSVMPLIQDAVLHNVNYTAFRSHNSWCKLIIHFKSFPCEALCALSVSSGDESSPGGGGEAQRDSPASGRVWREHYLSEKCVEYISLEDYYAQNIGMLVLRVPLLRTRLCVVDRAIIYQFVLALVPEWCVTGFVGWSASVLGHSVAPSSAAHRPPLSVSALSLTLLISLGSRRWNVCIHVNRRVRSHACIGVIHKSPCGFPQRHRRSQEACPRRGSQDKGQDGSQGARGGVDAGGVINLSSEDADSIMTFFMHCHYIWAIPLKIGVILALLWWQLGASAVVAAVAGILFLTPLQFVLCKKIAAVNKNFLDVSDERLRQTHELVTGIKLVKLHAWEDVFIRRVTSTRERELHLLYRDSIYRALMTFLTQGSGVVVCLVTFGLYSLLEGAALEPARVFSGLALFNQLTVPLFILPIIVSHTIRAKNSTRRLQEFLNMQEVEGPRTPKTPITLRPMGILRGGVGGGAKGRAGGRGKVCRTPRNSKGEGLLDDLRQNRLGRVVEESRPTSTCSEISNASSVSKKSSKENGTSPFSVDLNSDSDEELEFEGWKKRRSGGNGERGGDGRKVAVRIQSGSFAWDPTCRHSVLENITTEVPAGGLTVVVGGVGAGKTSLLLAMLGEMHTLRGELQWNGEMSVAYVSQHPWLMHATLRDNVAFGRQLLAKRYSRVIQACALAPDIEILPGGDQAEIGERGINLSGGQRQRVAIARALYSDARTVIMDAPFSALDAGVSAKVWEEGVVKLLLQRRRTVILATHLTHLTRHATKIIYLEGGSIKHQGTPSEMARAAPELWREWGTKEGAPVGGYDYEGRLEGRTARERWSLLRLVTRISIQRGSASPHHTRRGAREESKEVEFCPRPVRKYSINRHVSHSALLPGDECEYLPALTPPLPRHAFAHTPSKLPLFRIKSSAPAFGRKSSRAARGGLPRHAKSLPPQPRPLPRMRSTPAFAPQGNMLHRLFSSASIKSTKRPSTSPSDKWHLGRVISSSNNLGDDLDEDLELEEEVPLEEDVGDGRLVAEEERERGRISKWNYVVYLRACGLTFGLGYLFCALLGQSVSVMLDFWLGKWSGKADAWNMTERSHWEAYETHLRQKSLPGERAKPVDPLVLSVSDRYTAFVEETMDYYYKVYVGLSGVSVLLSLSTNILGQVAAARGRQRLHRDMLQNLAKCAVRFFDTTPAGRIMNRFTTDTAMIDKELARSVTHLLFFVLMVTSAVVVNAVVTPAFLVVAVPICGLYYAVQKFFRCSSRELKRLESLSRSPLYSHISESVAGAVVVRAYGHQRRFTDVLLHRLDTHVTAFTLLHAGNRWLGICLDYIGGVIVFCATVATLLWSTVFQYELKPAMVGLAINYTLLVPVYLNWVVRFLADTEMCLNAVERVQQYATLPAEDARPARRATPARGSTDRLLISYSSSYQLICRLISRLDYEDLSFCLIFCLIFPLRISSSEAGAVSFICFLKMVEFLFVKS
nr:ATP-binding cassette sub-family C member Sur-like [Penaeus vannamei]